MVRLYNLIDLDKWQEVEKNEYFLGLVLGVIRALFTYVQSKLPIASTNRVTHRKFGKLDITKAERFDKLIEKVSKNVKTQHTSLERSQQNILETNSERKFYTPKRGVLNQ